MMVKGRLSPRQAAEEAIEYLKNHADETRAASYQRYFKEPVDYFGVNKQDFEEFYQNLLARIEGVWTIREAVRFCNWMVKDPHMETRGLGFRVVADYVSEAPPTLLADVKRWLEGSCGNWALVDSTLAPSILAPLLELYPDLIPEVVSWTDSSSQWVRRGATVAFVPLVKQKKYVPTAYKIATRLFKDKEDLVHKAVGWLLRETGKSDTDRLKKFLLKHGPKIPRTTVRYAIERFPKEERKQLLQATRGKEK
jgi:3-methyladenine DNA glycosylase AlkD